ncbi:hypothetical protein CYY_007621 [Polysphondylium violaceum]|uniref:deoxyribose-phosphate aldolase n=1 Tax=Polysphondylium violaceum TaxID=133409 RepID=A0A8J4PNE6_9MYCE|nr:hypothetical protein CYY_007621 [Polysphondylium violaceum]
MQYSKYFDHTILKADATRENVLALCKEALEHDFASVCVNGYRTKLVAEQLRGSNVKVCTVVGFPLGAMSTAAKAYETEQAIKDGAQEIDMVVNIGALKDKDYDTVLQDIVAVKHACGDVLLKVIIETCLLSDEEKVKVCQLVVEAKAEYVKTSTGFSTSGATEHDVALMKSTVAGKALVKASGGIRDYETAQKMIAAGADRLGTSATIKIVNDSKK